MVIKVLDRMKAKICCFTYWPNMDKRFGKLARTSSNFELTAKSPRKTKLSSWPMPESAWSRLHIDLMVRVFANDSGDLGSIPGRVIPKTQKMVLDITLLNTQHYKVRIKGKVE